MPEVKESVLVPSAWTLRRRRKLHDFLTIAYQYTKWHLLLLCLWWGLLLGKNSWIVSCALPYFSLQFNRSFPSLASICCSKFYQQVADHTLHRHLSLKRLPCWCLSSC